MIVIDDALVVAALVGRLPEGCAGEALATTSTWWWRLLTALRRSTSGSLSRKAFGLSPDEREALEATVDDLASLVEVPDIRALLPLMGDLHRDHGLNLLAAEALAVAVTFDLAIRVMTDHPRLAAAAQELGVAYATV